MSLGPFTTGAPDWLSVAFGVFLAGVAILLWGYARHARVGRRAIVPPLLKLLAFAALALCLVEPLWTGTRAKPGANLFLLMADNSQGMTIRDYGATVSRGDGLRSVLAADPSPWQVRLEQDFDLRRYIFDSRLRSVPDFHELVFDGRSTSLRGALQAIAERFRSRPLAGVMLFTDGNATDLVDGIVPEGLPPIYPVVCGSDERSRDLSIANVAVSQTAFEDTPVTIRVDVQADGFHREQVVAQVLDESGTKLAEEAQQVNEPNQSITFRLSFQPSAIGVSFYKLQVAA
jgi:hypothetical protein